MKPDMSAVHALYHTITAELAALGKASAYTQDANEADPNYQSYGVRAPSVKLVIQSHAKAIKALTTRQQLDLANDLICSGYGEQQTVALSILERHLNSFGPDDLVRIDTDVAP